MCVVQEAKKPVLVALTFLRNLSEACGLEPENSSTRSYVNPCNPRSKSKHRILADLMSAFLCGYTSKGTTSIDLKYSASFRS